MVGLTMYSCPPRAIFSAPCGVFLTSYFYPHMLECGLIRITLYTSHNTVVLKNLIQIY